MESLNTVLGLLSLVVVAFWFISMACEEKSLRDAMFCQSLLVEKLGPGILDKLGIPPQGVLDQAALEAAIANKTGLFSADEMVALKHMLERLSTLGHVTHTTECVRFIYVNGIMLPRKSNCAVYGVSREDFLGYSLRLRKIYGSFLPLA